MQFFRSPLNKAPTKGKKKKVQLSKNLECQVQIILTTEGNEGAYEEAFEEWKEEMPDTIFDESDTEDMEEDEREATPVIVDPIIDQHLKDGTPVTPTTKREPTKPLLNLEENSFSQNHMETVGETTPPPPTPPHQTNTQEPQYLQQSQQPQKQVSGLRRLFSLGKKDKPENLPKIDTTSNATTSLEEAENNQYHVLRIFSGNINVGALFNTVAVTPDMNADQLLKLALQKFHIPLIENSNRSSLNGIEYFLTVKSMDSGM